MYIPGRPGMPTWLRWLLLLIPLLLLLLLLLTLLSCDESGQPESLAESRLTGPRLTAGPVCIEEAVDVSGSMLDYVPDRERAERELFAFAGRELRPEDQISVVFFSDTGQLALPPTSLQGLGTPPAVPVSLEGGGTQLAPAIDTLVGARPSADACAARALVLISDGVIYDDPAVLDASLRAANYTRMFAVIPANAGGGRPSELQGGLLDSIEIHHFYDGGSSEQGTSVLDDAKPLDVVFGEVLGSLTGQQLTRVAAAPAGGTIATIET